MPKYTEHFHLKPEEIDLIEHALRREISFLSKQDSHRQTGTKNDRGRVRHLNELLGKLFNQKKFYAQVNKTGVPAG